MRQDLGTWVLSSHLGYILKLVCMLDDPSVGARINGVLVRPSQPAPSKCAVPHQLLGRWTHPLQGRLRSYSGSLDEIYSTWAKNNATIGPLGQAARSHFNWNVRNQAALDSPNSHDKILSTGERRRRGKTSLDTVHAING